MSDYLLLDGKKYDIKNCSFSRNVSSNAVYDMSRQQQGTVTTGMSISGSFEADNIDAQPVVGQPTGEVRVKDKANGKSIVLKDIIITGKTSTPQGPADIDFVAKEVETTRLYSKLTESFK